jgi:hypothetical protein
VSPFETNSCEEIIKANDALRRRLDGFGARNVQQTYVATFLKHTPCEILEINRFRRAGKSYGLASRLSSDGLDTDVLLPSRSAIISSTAGEYDGIGIRDDDTDKLLRIGMTVEERAGNLLYAVERQVGMIEPAALLVAPIFNFKTLQSQGIMKGHVICGHDIDVSGHEGAIGVECRCSTTHHDRLASSPLLIGTKGFGQPGKKFNISIRQCHVRSYLSPTDEGGQ